MRHLIAVLAFVASGVSAQEKHLPEVIPLGVEYIETVTVCRTFADAVWAATEFAKIRTKKNLAVFKRIFNSMTDEDRCGNAHGPVMYHEAVHDTDPSDDGKIVYIFRATVMNETPVFIVSRSWGPLSAEVVPESGDADDPEAEEVSIQQ